MSLCTEQPQSLHVTLTRSGGKLQTPSPHHTDLLLRTGSEGWRPEEDAWSSLLLSSMSGISLWTRHTQVVFTAGLFTLVCGVCFVYTDTHMVNMMWFNTLEHIQIIILILIIRPRFSSLFLSRSSNRDQLGASTVIEGVGPVYCSVANGQSNFKLLYSPYLQITICFLTRWDILCPQP